MGLTQKLGTIPLAISTDASNNVGIGAAASGSYKLQVTGTTNLTGALSGTSATFSGALRSNGVEITNSANADILDIFQSPSALNSFIDYPSGRSLIIRNKGSLGGLSIASTGAATFSSSVTATSGTFVGLVDILNSTLPLRIVNTISASNQQPWIKLRQAQNNLFGFDIGIDTTTGGDFFISRANGSDTITEAFRIARATGAATFSSLAGSGSRTVTADASGNLSASSDSSLKQEDTNHQIEGLAEILQLQPRAYKWKSDIEIRGEDATTEIGFFANEVNAIIPSAAPKGNDNLFGFYDRAVIAALVKAIQELSAQNQDLKSRLDKAGL